MLSRAAAEPLVSPTADDVFSVDAEIVSATVATIPFEIVLELIPQRTHVELPALLLQEICLPAAVAAAPAVTVADVKSTVESLSVHWTEAGWVPELFRLRLKVTVVPGVPDPDERLRVTPCEKPKHDDNTANTMIRKKISGVKDLAGRDSLVRQSSRSSNSNCLVL